jgi:phage terminase small subunit
MLGIFLMYTSCDNTAQKVVKAEENVVDAEKDLQMAKEEYLADIEQYKLLSAEKIAANDRSIAEFNARIEQEKKEVRADYKAKIKSLETKNSDMKKKMDEYRVEGKDKWELFKTEFGKDMDELGESISNFGKKD